MEAHSDGRRWVLPVVVSAGALALTGVVAGCGDETERGEAPIEVTFEQVLSNTDAYAGRQIMVLAGVGQVAVAPGAFTLGEEVGDDDLYVLPTTEAKLPSDDIDEDSVVRVHGRVEIVDGDLLEEEEFIIENVAGFDEERLDGSPAVVASQIEVIDNPH